jgi:hypothetical protein
MPAGCSPSQMTGLGREVGIPGRVSLLHGLAHSADGPLCRKGTGSFEPVAVFQVLDKQPFNMRKLKDRFWEERRTAMRPTQTISCYGVLDTDPRGLA